MMTRMTTFRYSRAGAAPFDLANPADEAELSPDDQAFATILRERAAAWQTDDEWHESWTDVWDGDEARKGILAGLDLGVIDQDIHGAAHVQGRLHCGPLHAYQALFWCPWSPGLEHTEQGSPEDLAHHAADWFENLLRRPVVLWLWSRRRFGHRDFYAGRYEFADSADLIAEWYDHERAPAAETRQLRENGHYIEHASKLRLTTEGLRQPDAFRYIRGARAAARIPTGSREVHVGDSSREFTKAGALLGCHFRWETRRAHELGLSHQHDLLA